MRRMIEEQATPGCHAGRLPAPRARRRLPSRPRTLVLLFVPWLLGAGSGDDRPGAAPTRATLAGPSALTARAPATTARPARSRPAPPAAARPARAPGARVRHHRYRHTVLPGETMGEIARRYGVKIKDIQRWNDLEGVFLREGEQLDLYTPTPIRERRELTHTVRAGETLAAVARRYHVTPASIARLNRLGASPRLRAGQRLRLVLEGPEKPSISRGKPQDGALVAGEQLPPGAGYFRRNPSRAWGTNTVIAKLTGAFHRLSQRLPGRQAAVGDLSVQHGGFLAPHASHQNGRDVDISLYLIGQPKLTTFVRATPRTLDTRATLALLDALLAGGGVQYVFLVYDLQRPLYERAKKAGWPAARLARTFQYPRGIGASGIVVHEPGHDDHLHVRFER